jgi:hypothetical protein
MTTFHCSDVNNCIAGCIILYTKICYNIYLSVLTMYKLVVILLLCSLFCVILCDDCYKINYIDETTNLCFYNTYKDSAVVMYICKDPVLSCMSGVCQKCVPVYSIGINIASIILSCFALLLVCIISIVLMVKKRRY